MHITLSVILLLLLTIRIFASEMIPERRKAQFLDEPGYLILPAPYSMPGLGSGIAYYGGANNYLGRTDMFAVKTTGDAEGTLLGLWDLHLIDRTAILDMTYLDFSHTAFNQYAARGMESGKNDYSIAELDHYQGLSLKFYLSFFERRLEIYTRYNQSESRTVRLLDYNGDIRQEIADPSMNRSHHTDVSAVVDLTDDRQDPHHGVRGYMDVSHHTPDGDTDPEFYTLTWNVTGYLPINHKSTIALNYQHSDALMVSKGETDKDAISQSSYRETFADLSQEARLQVENSYLYNTHGNARSLGGENALRSYPGDRFTGAHSRLIGAELRWNFKAERKPIDLYFIRDIRTGVQVALFHEIGTVADNASDIWKDTRSSSGVGVRFIMGSGFVYRFDYATGDEGEEMTIFVSYPWEDL